MNTIIIRIRRSTAKEVQMFTLKAIVSLGLLRLGTCCYTGWGWWWRFSFKSVSAVTWFVSQPNRLCPVFEKTAGATTIGSGSLSWHPCWGPCWAPVCMQCSSTGICPGPGRTSLTTPWSSQTSPRLGRDDLRWTLCRTERIWARSGWIEDELSVYISEGWVQRRNCFTAVGFVSAAVVLSTALQTKYSW